VSGAAPSRWIALVFVILGGWALLHPSSVIALSFLPEYRGGAALPFAVGAFGAQALIAGLFAATARFTRATYAGYAVMLAGFLAFDARFGRIDPVLTLLRAGLDAVGNLAILLLCLAGYRSVQPPRS
jgi:hypothetical protein